MRRFLTLALSLLVLVLVVRWLVSRPVLRFVLGPGEELVAEPGLDTFVVREGEGLWRAYTTAARRPSDGALLPVASRGRPVLLATGSVLVLADRGLLWCHATHPIVRGGEVLTLLAPEDLPPEARLEGALAARDAVLSTPVEGGRQLLVTRAGPLLDPRPERVASAEGPALVPEGEAVLCARGARALAFRGERGWEAWLIGEDGGARRAVAEGCRGRDAVFTPDGLQLVVEGRQGGLWLLDLPSGRLNHMGAGDLGSSRRVPHGSGFRFEDLRLVCPQRDLDGWLQIYQTHVPSGRRWGFGLGFTHHYSVALSPTGRYMAWVQAVFDENDDAPFVEELYLYDFDEPASAATPLGGRTGGRAGQGPVFLGSGESLIFLADGEAVRIEVAPPEQGD